MKQLTKKVQPRTNLPSKNSAPIRNEKRLRDRETRIGDMLTIRTSADFTIGEELYAIQQEGDFKDKTFEAYIKRRWERSRAWGYQLIDSFKIKSALPQNVQSSIQNTNQALALGAAPEAERPAIIEQVAAEQEAVGKPVTAAAIAEKIEERITLGLMEHERPHESKKKSMDVEFDLLDKTGFIVPKWLQAQWQCAEKEGNALLALLKSAQKIMKDKIGKDSLWIELTNNDNARIRALASDAKRIIPHAVCVTCEGKNTKAVENCDHCKARGFFSEFIWNLVPDKQRKGRK